MFNLYLYVAISAGTGTAIVEILLKLFLSDWIKRRFYKFKLLVSDKRNCSDEIIELISPQNYNNWSDFSNEIYNKAYQLSDRLETMSATKVSRKLDEYVTEQRISKTAIDNLLQDTASEELPKYFLKSQEKISKLRKELVSFVAELRKGN